MTIDFRAARNTGLRYGFISAAAIGAVLISTAPGPAQEPSPASRIAIGDSADAVLHKLGVQPDRAETSRVLGVTYEDMRFHLAGAVITVRLIFDHVIDVETRPNSTLGNLLGE